MGGALIGLVVAGVLLFLGLMIWWSWLSAKKRREALSALATERGWTWTARDDRWQTRFEGAPFGHGRSRRCDNVLTGVHDSRPFTAFDYQYTETHTDSDGKSSSTTYRYSVVAVETAAPFPVLQVGPEGFFSRLIDAVTNQDIDFEWEEFNRTFRVTSADRRFANDVLHQQTMEFLMQHPKIAWRFRNQALLVVSTGRHDVAEIDRKLAFCDGVLDRVPGYVWERFGVLDPGRPGPDRP